MHDNILDIPVPYPLVLVRFVSQDGPGGKYLAWSCKIQWDLAGETFQWDLSSNEIFRQWDFNEIFHYYGCFLSIGGEITQTNNQALFVEIWWLHAN